MKRILLAFSILSAMCFASLPAQAGTASTTLTVSVSVSDGCIVSSYPISFPAYNALTTNLTTPDDNSAGYVQLQCSTGIAPTIGLDLGNNVSGSVAHMALGTNYLSYAIYQDASRITIWGNTSSNWKVVSAFPNSNAQYFPIYARIPAGQGVPSGTYADTITATVNF